MSSQEALERAAERERLAVSRRGSRKMDSWGSICAARALLDPALEVVTELDFVGGIAAATTALLATRRSLAAPRPPTTDIGIVGAGLAGLQAAYELGRVNIAASVYEASTRVGGRQVSLRGTFPGQVAERGGELIDNLHKTMHAGVRVR